MSDAIFSALHHLACALLESGALSEEQIVQVADGVEADAQDISLEERRDFEWAAHVLRWAIVEVGGEPPNPPTLPLRLIDGGK